MVAFFPQSFLFDSTASRLAVVDHPHCPLSATPLGPADVRAACSKWIDEGVVELISLPASGGSAADAAAALGVVVDRIVKSIGVLVDTKSHNTANAAALAPVLLLLSGDTRADLGIVANYMNVPKKAVRMASAAECISVFGFAPGSMPPTGHRTQLRVLIDKQVVNGCPAPSEAPKALSLKQLEPSQALFCGGGSADTMMAVAASQLQLVSNATVLHLTKRASDVRTSPPMTDKSMQQASSVTGELSLLVDASLGRLARWLRCLGVDTEYIRAADLPPTDPDDTAPYGRAKVNSHQALVTAAAGGRTVLTRDRKIIERNLGGTMVLFIEDDEPKKQLAQVVSHFGIRYNEAKLLTRCAKCNGLVKHELSAEEVSSNETIPDKVRSSTARFWSCDRCAKVYWVGPKSKSAVQFIGELREDASLCALLQPPIGPMGSAA